MHTEKNEQGHEAEVILLNQRAVFTLDQARHLLPIVVRVTERWHKEAQTLARKFEATKDLQQRDQLDRKFRDVVQTWSRQIEALGAEAKSPWLVDFDTGDGRYWCWRFPEVDLQFVHTHASGFAGRTQIAEDEECH